MLRTLFNISAIVSLLICLVASVMWIRSYWVSDRWVTKMSPEGARTALYTQRGWIKFLERAYVDPQSKEISSISLIGPISIPFVVIVVLSAVLPVVWLILWRRGS